MSTITDQQLLAEFDDLMRTMPPRQTLANDDPEIEVWFGRALMLIGLWNPLKAPFFEGHVNQIHSSMARNFDEGVRKTLTMLHQARQELRLKTVGPLTVVVNQGGVWDYFDEMRKIIETAKEDLFFIDQYMDADFVSRYLPHVTQGTKVRLLTSKRLPVLMPAVQLLRQQMNLAVEVRSADGFHDRYIFVDNQAGYQSGASFKDGAKNSPTTLTQVIDSLKVVLNTYEQIWANAKIEQ